MEKKKAAEDLQMMVNRQSSIERTPGGDLINGHAHKADRIRGPFGVHFDMKAFYAYRTRWYNILVIKNLFRPI